MRNSQSVEIISSVLGDLELQLEVEDRGVTTPHEKIDIIREELNKIEERITKKSEAVGVENMACSVEASPNPFGRLDENPEGVLATTLRKWADLLDKQELGVQAFVMEHDTGDCTYEFQGRVDLRPLSIEVKLLASSDWEKERRLRGEIEGLQVRLKEMEIIDKERKADSIVREARFLYDLNAISISAFDKLKEHARLVREGQTI